ncbi:MAG: hypothetical protein K8H88_11475 [Sandaracinaceae bacterium]|nr:hypothetical protein [Sandaracinaceae bacterium]
MLAAVTSRHEPDEAIAVEPDGLMARMRRLFQAHRRRLATLSLFIFLAAVASRIASALPDETRVALPLSDPATLLEARVSYWYEGRALHEVQLRYPPGQAPSTLRHTLDLSPGDYDVNVELVREGGGHQSLRGHLTAPSDGEIRVHLEASR